MTCEELTKNIRIIIRAAMLDKADPDTTIESVMDQVAIYIRENYPVQPATRWAKPAPSELV